ncbi:hypothetical protein CR513_56413, partial [Mucuna pruriens]
MSSELVALQGEHEEKSLKIEELKRKIELTKHLLEKKKNKVREEHKAAPNYMDKNSIFSNPNPLGLSL